ncbi:MAG: hypothetical protein ACFFEM_06805 [Candidatus Thorarchaeota archaeon]
MQILNQKSSSKRERNIGAVSRFACGEASMVLATESMYPSKTILKWAFTNVS